MDFISGQTLLEVCEKEKLPISEVMKQREITCGKMPEKEIREKLYEVGSGGADPATEKVHGRADRRRGKAGGRP